MEEKDAKILGLQKVLKLNEETIQNHKDQIEAQIQITENKKKKINELEIEISILNNKNTKMGMNLVQLEKDLREVFERENFQKDEINRLGRLNQKLKEQATIMEDQLL